MCRHNKIFCVHGEKKNMDWVKYDAKFTIDWEDERSTPALRSVHPCFLWLANHCFERQYFQDWYKEVYDNIRPPNDNKNNGHKCKYSYPWFKMNCFASFAFNCTRYAYSQYQTNIAKSLSQVCSVNELEY